MVVAKDEKFAFDLINKEMEARKYDFERENESCREIKLLPGETLKLTDELEAHYWLRGSI